MESNWRLNVADFGWSRTMFRLIARLRTPIDQWRYVALATVGPQRRVYLGQQPIVDGVNQWSFFGLVPDQHFPFGHDVLPD